MNHRIAPRILLIGTADTKGAELSLLRGEIEKRGAGCVLMDVGVVGEAEVMAGIDRHTVAAAAGTTIENIAHGQDENTAMGAMAAGASKLAAALADRGDIDGVLAIGGTMGTDLALEVAAALPVGLAKVIVSTVAFSHIIPPERLSSDLTMMLWTGGLWGMNEACRSVLRQAAGAVVGAAECARPLVFERPVVGLSTLGTSVLRYVTELLPALDERGYEVLVFHAVGMGGRSLEQFAAQGRLAAVLDLCLIEVGNWALGSTVHSGPDRLSAAGARGIPQILAPGGLDSVDYCTWSARPRVREESFRVHNRLVGSSATSPEDKAQVAMMIAERANLASGPVAVVLPLDGFSEWDRAGSPMWDPEGVNAFADAMEARLSQTVDYRPVRAHINDHAFVDAVLSVFDQWVERGDIPRGVPSTASPSPSGQPVGQER
ncbi:Tm-1-like ATP-binding domain-containing protein [Lentzea sp. NPDC004782]|uniref:Tm-1-like ATP-binding domain-containing protein n=1 Tax=Lentzea sp. NPDC004782 TaxID=3154458 RepID=UPI0033AFD062